MDEYNRVTKQTPTFANLQTIAQELQRRVEQHGSLSDEEAKEFIDSYNDGKDAWGTPFVFKSKAGPPSTFIVVSLGSDKAIDVMDIDSYFEMKQIDIVGDLKHDIVFRDGRYVTAASPK